MNVLTPPKQISFDFATIKEVVIRKWWIVPLTMLIGFSLMFWQESDLKTSPRYFSLTRTYEPIDESAPLSLVGINTDLISQFPNESNQVIILQSEAIKAKILNSFTGELNLIVESNDKTFSLNTETDGPGTTRFSFKPSRRFSYTFSCSEQTEKNCAVAIDTYANELKKIRLTATKAGFQNSVALIDALLTSGIDIPAELKAQLNLQTNAFTQSIKLASGDIMMVSESKEYGGEFIATVDTKTYLFGLIAGLIIGLLILTQIVVSDGNIRSKKKLVAIFGYQNFLGEISKNPSKSSLQHLAAAIRGSAVSNISTNLRLVPVGSSIIDPVIESEFKTILGCEVTSTKPVEMLNADDLAPLTNWSFVFMVENHRSKVSELRSAWMVVEKSGNEILGIALIN